MIVSYITGGLANQMFQLSASLSAFQNEEIKLIWGKGAKISSGSAFPEVFDFNLPANVSGLSPRAISQPLQKMLNYLLVRGANEAPKTIVFFVTKLILEIFFTLRLKGFCKVYISQGLGFYPIEKKSKNLVLIGYFQSYIYTRDAKYWFGMDILTKSIERKLNQLGFDNLMDEMFTAVHVRLGDYRRELSFGILTDWYYHGVLSKLSLQETRRIVLFSDEPENCLSRIPEELRVKTWIVPPSVFTSAETLALMSRASIFVLANSTFSWWGARLGKKQDEIVFAPKPWFSTNKVPNNLYPPKWILIKAHFYSIKYDVYEY